MAVETRTSSLLRIAEVEAMLDLSNSTVRRLNRTDPAFPKAVRIGHGLRWRSDDVEQYATNGAAE